MDDASTGGRSWRRERTFGAQGWARGQIVFCRSLYPHVAVDHGVALNVTWTFGQVRFRRTTLIAKAQEEVSGGDGMVTQRSGT